MCTLKSFAKKDLHKEGSFPQETSYAESYIYIYTCEFMCVTEIVRVCVCVHVYITYHYFELSIADDT